MKNTRGKVETRGRDARPGSQGGFSQMGGMMGNNQMKRDQRPRKKRNPIGKEAEFVDYLDLKTLNRFINDQGKILPKRITGVTTSQQRLVTRAVKYARHLALFPFVEKDLN